MSTREYNCLECGKPCTLKCSKCKAVFFCNGDCQRALWPSHKALCKRVSQARSQEWNLIIDGMGPVGPNWEYCKGARREMEAADLHVVVVDVTKGSKMPEQVAAILRNRTPQSILMLGWGSGDGDVESDFCECKDFQMSLVNWCRSGGRLLVQGERLAMFPWPSWFDLAWKSGDYCRTDHFYDVTTSHWCNWFRDAPAAVRATYNVKSCCLANVDPADALFSTRENSKTYSPVPGFGGRDVGTGQTAIAWSKFGNGTVSFFGDVNHEDATLRTMALIASRGQQ